MQINIQKRHLVIIVSVIVLLGVVGYGIAVVPSPGHSGAEIESLPWSKLTNVPAGLSDGDDVGGGCDDPGVCSRVCIGDDCRSKWPTGLEGGIVVWVGNVGKLVKDGAAISQLFCRVELGFAANTYGQARIQNGQIQTRAWVDHHHRLNDCDSGWVTGTSASCETPVTETFHQGYKVKAVMSANADGGTLTSYWDEGTWLRGRVEWKQMCSSSGVWA